MQNKNKKSIWGNWWASIRKWFYPVWLMYELSIRFYEYGESVYNYIIGSETIQSNIGEIGTLTLSFSGSIVTFAGCTLFLTVPACFILYKFFESDNFTGSRFEEKIKIVF